MTIKFNHHGEICADVIVDAEQDSDLILVFPKSNNAELGDNIILVKENGKWRAGSYFEKKFPSTVYSLISNLHLL
jgi:hypothetical protein